MKKNPVLLATTAGVVMAITFAAYAGTAKQAKLQANPQNYQSMYNTLMDKSNAEEAMKAADRIDNRLAEMIFLNAVASEAQTAEKVSVKSGELPAYEYPGKAGYQKAVAEYLVEEIGSYYDQADVTIPVVDIAEIDETDGHMTTVTGDFWVYNYNLNGQVLELASGGHHPGVAQIEFDDINGTFEVKAFEEINGYTSDGDLGEALRIESVDTYIQHFNLDVTQG